MERQYTSGLINELASALAKAQSEMIHAGKSAANPFFKSKYADLPSIMDAARPSLTKNGLSVAQFPDIDENGKIFLVTQLSHSSGQWMRSWYPVKPVKDDPQGLGSATTYARRYSYGCITGVVATDEDDDGNAASGHKIDQKPETAISKKKRFSAIKEAIQESNDPANTWHEHMDEINGFLEADKTFYDDLVQAGKLRKQYLAQEESIRIGMPDGFNGVHQ